MSRRSLVLFLVVFAFPAPASAIEWSLGAHLGLADIRSGSRASGSTTAFAVPGNTFAYQPALRVAAGDARHAHEWFVDTGQLYLDEAGSHYQMVLAEGGYQYAWRGERAVAPFASVCFGWWNEGGAARRSTSATFGAGLGVRRVVGDRHGALRAELRVDRLKGSAIFGRPDLTSFGLRFGFDLWS